jgi:hypothetical protein
MTKFKKYLSETIHFAHTDNLFLISHLIVYWNNILGVHKKSSNFAAKCELGRPPVLNFITILALKYFNRLKQLPSDMLLGKVYEVDKSLFGWFSKWHIVIRKLQYLWKNIFSLRNSLIFRWICIKRGAMSQDSLIKMPFPCVVCDQEILGT